MYERRTFVMEDAQFEVLFDFIFENKTYIVYTNYHMNKFGKTELFAAEVVQNNDCYNVTLKPVDSQLVLKRVNIEIQKYLKSD